MKIAIVSYGLRLDWERVKKEFLFLTSRLTVKTVYYVGCADHSVLVKQLVEQWAFCAFVELFVFAVSPRSKTRRLSLSPRSTLKLSEDLIEVLSSAERCFVFTDIPDGLFIHERLLKKSCSVTTVSF